MMMRLFKYGLLIFIYLCFLFFMFIKRKNSASRMPNVANIEITMKSVKLILDCTFFRIVRSNGGVLLCVPHEIGWPTDKSKLSVVL